MFKPWSESKRYSKVLCKTAFCLYFRRVPPVNRCPISHETLFDPADWQLTVDVLSNITRFLGANSSTG